MKTYAAAAIVGLVSAESSFVDFISTMAIQEA